MHKFQFVLSLLLCALSATLLTPVAADTIRDRLRQRHETTTTTTTTTTTPVPRYDASVIVSKNLPDARPGCTVHFDCKKKVKNAAQPKPCIKYCVKNIECPDGTRVRGKPNECFELVEERVAQEHSEYLAQLQREREEQQRQQAAQGGGGTQGAVNIMEVAMIDFPCQPGYLPDSRGRCREVW